MVNQTTGSGRTDEVEVSILINAVFYLLQTAVILTEDETYRLIVIQKGHIVLDKNFLTARGARIGFARKFKPDIQPGETKAEWGIFLKPETDWFEQNGMRLMMDEENRKEYVITVI